MKDAIAIAIAKAKSKTKKNIYNDFGTPEKSSTETGSQITRTWFGVLLMTGALVGFGAIICFVVGLINSGGLLQFLNKWLSAMTGN